MIDKLPPDVLQQLPAGYQANQGVWLVLPEPGQADRGIRAVNAWLRAEDWYPAELNAVVWFGDDGVGNFIGWRPEQGVAVLWNPEDGAAPWREGTVQELWAFIESGYL
ncbi:MAG: hypothetical protein NTZ11_00045 [Gammaproteobacteria bacterium]|nr:hypothetical protein [Gammaproteobacteria bacterium]